MYVEYVKCLIMFYCSVGLEGSKDKGEGSDNEGEGSDYEGEG